MITFKEMQATIQSVRSASVAIAVIVLGFSVFGLAGCKATGSGESAIAERSAPAEERGAATEAPGQMITTFGEHRIGNTVIAANESEGKLSVKHITEKDDPAGGGRSTFSSAMSTPPKEWPLQDGWFAYAAGNGAQVWLYNGGGKLLLVERKESPERGVTNIYGTNHLPVAVPAPVLDRVNPELRRELQKSSEKDL
ncbi:MAG TPA: hypothetical protein VF773_20660 [Verrucomicrobiae bacterium]